MKTQLTTKLRRKKENLMQVKLRIRTQGADSQEALRAALPVRSGRHSHIHFQDKRIIHQNAILTFYIKFAKDAQSR